MKTSALVLVGLLSVVIAAPAFSADESRVKQKTQQVEDGVKKIGKGEVGAGVEQTARGIGGTVVEGAKFTGEKFKESGQAAEPHAKSAWEHTRDGAVAFGRGVKNFFSSLFSN